ncbi:unnamed protein product [Allacma fusca]|uniref:Uncharacterized protein n=1 Tax=Allacma fusca TaxID=39272 RepID=A0A8J2JP85_9HEXA|nr:unnamed protein product [Allacma fusca]
MKISLALPFWATREVKWENKLERTGFRGVSSVSEIFRYRHLASIRTNSGCYFPNFPSFKLPGGTWRDYGAITKFPYSSV